MPPDVALTTGHLRPWADGQHRLGLCPKLPYMQQNFEHFERVDAEYHGKRTDIENLVAMDGSACKAVTPDGMAMSSNGACVDFGVPGNLHSSSHVLPFGASMTFEYLPARDSASRSTAARRAFQMYSSKLQLVLERQQFVADRAIKDGCGVRDAPQWRAMYYVHDVPMIGFGSVIEYGMMFLARATQLGTQLVFGSSSSPVWTSPWACGQERSLGCYFNTSSCCGMLTMDRSPLRLPRRRNPINLGLRGHDEFGTAALSGQLAHFFFSRMTPATRDAVDKRRASVLPRRPGGGLPTSSCIGMHVRGGDACHAHRFCPSNLTATYFAQAARLRSLYGVNVIVMATDSPSAAAACRAAPLGFECRTMPMARDKFDSPTFIEARVAKHEGGALSGSTVALDTLADIDMLADCDHHVLIFRSAVSRLAYGLAVARHGGPTPVVSMQLPFGTSSAKLFMKRGKKAKHPRAGASMDVAARPRVGARPRGNALRRTRYRSSERP